MADAARIPAPNRSAPAAPGADATAWLRAAAAIVVEEAIAAELAAPGDGSIAGELGFLDRLLDAHPAALPLMVRGFGELRGEARVDVARLVADRRVRRPARARAPLAARRPIAARVAAAVTVMVSAQALAPAAPAAAAPAARPADRATKRAPVPLWLVDAATREPIAFALIRTADEDVVAFTDEAGRALVPVEALTEPVLILEHEVYRLTVIDVERLAARVPFTMDRMQRGDEPALASAPTARPVATQAPEPAARPPMPAPPAAPARPVVAKAEPVVAKAEPQVARVAPQAAPVAPAVPQLAPVMAKPAPAPAAPRQPARVVIQAERVTAATGPTGAEVESAIVDVERPAPAARAPVEVARLALPAMPVRPLDLATGRGVAPAAEPTAAARAPVAAQARAAAQLAMPARSPVSAEPTMPAQPPASAQPPVSAQAPASAQPPVSAQAPTTVQAPTPSRPAAEAPVVAALPPADAAAPAIGAALDLLRKALSAPAAAPAFEGLPRLDEAPPAEAPAAEAPVFIEPPGLDATGAAGPAQAPAAPAVEADPIRLAPLVPAPPRAAARPAAPRAAVRERVAATPRMDAYVVRPGDTLGTIAKRELGSAKRWQELLAANADRLRNPHRLEVRMELRIPRAPRDVARAVRRSGDARAAEALAALGYAPPPRPTGGARPAAAAPKAPPAGVKALATAAPARPRAAKALRTAPAPTAATTPLATYVIQAGDSLSGIAERELGSRLRWRELWQANRAVVRRPSQISPGQVIVLPGVPAAAIVAAKRPVRVVAPAPAADDAEVWTVFTPEPGVRPHAVRLPRAVEPFLDPAQDALPTQEP